MNQLKEQLAEGLRNIGIRFGISATSLAQHSFLVTLSHVVSVLRGIVTGYLVARLFPRDLYGQYQLVLTVIGTLGAIGISDLYKAVARAIARGQPAAIWPVAKYQFYWCTAESLFLIAALPFLHFFDRQELLWPMLVAAALFPFSQVAGLLLQSIVIGKQNFRLGMEVNMITTVVVILAMLVPLLIHPSISLLIVVTMGVPAAVALIVSTKRLPKAQDTPAAKEVFWYGAQLTLLNAPVTLSWYLDKFLVSRYYGLGQLAVFSVALLLPEQLKVWAGELLPITFASQARGEDSKARRLKLLRIVFGLTIVFSALLGLYIAAAPWLFTWLFPNYTDAVLYTQLAAALLFTVPCGLLTQYLEAQAMVRELRWTRWIAAITFCLSLVTLVPNFGVVGALWSRGILRVSYALCVLYFLLTAPIQIKKPRSTEAPVITP
jgi:O-antigen/teichoic acid export membrane protein